MVRPDRPTESSPHSFNLPAVDRRGPDYEGFFIAQLDPEADGNMGGVPDFVLILNRRKRRKSNENDNTYIFNTAAVDCRRRL
jgi:hypothetical protein